MVFFREAVVHFIRDFINTLNKEGKKMRNASYSHFKVQKTIQQQYSKTSFNYNI